MKLFLSSQGIPVSEQDNFVQLFDKATPEIRLACILDASEVYSEEEKRPWFFEAQAELQSLGCQVEEIFLKDFVDNTEGLKDLLTSKDGVWVVGGNAHYLRYMMRVSGFDDLIRSLLAKGFVYAGYSAGAMMVSATIKYTDLDGEMHVEPERVDDGLGLIDQAIIPHWGRTDRLDYLEAVAAAYESEGVGLLKLADGQAVVINEDFFAGLKASLT